MEREERLHICLGTQCNNNCVFCMEDDRESRRRRLAKIDTSQARRILEEAPTRDEVMFTAGEPTLRPDLLELIRAARDLGFQRVGLITNGRRFAYLEYLQQALEAGLNSILVSVHGPDARLHDALTRTPKAFEQTVAGMHNIAGLRRQGAEVRFVTTTVLNRRNLSRLVEHVRFLKQFEPDQMVFNCIQPVGRGEQHFSTLVPRYPEVVAAFAEAIRQPGAEGGRLFLLDVPACLTQGLPPETVGFVELHRHYEPDERERDDPPPGDERRVAEGGQRQTPERSGKRAGEPGMAGPGAPAEGRATGRSGPLRLVTKEATDQILRVHGPDCPRCAAYRGCEGIWRRYAQEFGFGEFVPLRDGGRMETA